MKYERLFTFGCSYTQFVWPTWADIIAYDLSIPYQNWGLAGTGNISIAHRMLECDLRNKFTDRDLILVNWSSFHREDRIEGNSPYWNCGGNVFNNNSFGNKFIKKYWSPTNDIVKNCTAIISSNKMFNINYQSYMIDYQDNSEGGEVVYDFNQFSHYLENMPEKHVFESYGNSQFNNTIWDSHPDILQHLKHAIRISKELGHSLSSSTIIAAEREQEEVIKSVTDKDFKKIADWPKLEQHMLGLKWQHLTPSSQANYY